MANLKIVTGKLAIGCDKLEVQNWLFSAVNSSGAVSPEIRATASSTPVTTPAFTARRRTIVATFQRGAPRANAASRKLLGTSASILSVVRTTTGIAISEIAKLPAQPEKCLVLAT